MSQLNLSDLWAAYRTERSVSAAPTTAGTTWTQVTRFLKECPYKDPMEARLAMVWVLQREPKKTAKRVAQYIKTLMRWAVSEEVGLVPRNPVATFRLPKDEQRTPPVVIPRDLIDRVIDSLYIKGYRNRWDLLARFQLQTGLRTAEVFGLQLKDCSLTDRTCRIHQTMTLTHGLQPRTKTNKERVVPLNQVALDVLHELIKQFDLTPECFLFPWCRQSYAKAFSRAMDRLIARGVIEKKFRPYDLRHTFISTMLEEGVSVAQVARWCGNTPEVCWTNYVGVSKAYEIPVI